MIRHLSRQMRLEPGPRWANRDFSELGSGARAWCLIRCLHLTLEAMEPQGGGEGNM